MLKNISIGQYYAGDSVIHRLDPRTKFVLTLVYIIFIFFIKTYFGYLALAAFTTLVIILSGIPFLFVLRGLRPLFVFILLTFFINVFFTTGQTVFFEFGIIKLTWEGLNLALYMALRLIFLIICTSILTLTTRPTALTDGLESLMMPLTRFNFPAHELAMMMTIALRFIPTLMDEADKIIKAQTARGADFTTGSLAKRAKNIIPILIPLFVSAFRRAGELANAMESRCYRGGEGRTHLKQLKVTGIDYVAYGICFCFIAATIIGGL